ncbi:MAG: hypothetical protein R3A10_05590 [Caldilineaceae bacterium]
MVGFRIAFLLSGTIIVETVFALPGIGRLFTDFRLSAWTTRWSSRWWCWPCSLWLSTF